MKELKSITLSENISSIKRKISDFRNKKEIPAGFSESEFQSLKNETRSEIAGLAGFDSTDIPFIVTGHQPDFHHPGILFKDLLASRIANETGGKAIHLIVDNDQFEINLNVPMQVVKGEASLSKIVIPGKKYGIYSGAELSPEDRKLLTDALHGSSENISCFVAERQIGDCRESITSILENLKKSGLASPILESVRNNFYSKNGIQIAGISVSDIATMNSFRVFSQKIRDRSELFAEIFNSSLDRYRIQHKIKNLAQPLPNLEKNEMPFWILDRSTGARLPMLKDSTDTGILPRAITLTMFTRIFFADYFLHGTGGGRYEEVSDKALNEFFRIDGAPYTIVTATMNLVPKDCFPTGFPDQKEIDQNLRDLKHSPEKFLPATEPLALQKKQFLFEFATPDSNKKELNGKIREVNEKMNNLLRTEQEKWEDFRKNYSKNEKTKEVFETRTFPFFYYDIRELIDYVNNTV